MDLKGIVDVLGGVETIRMKISRVPDLIDLIQIGLPRKCVKHVKDNFKLTDQQMGNILGHAPEPLSSIPALRLGSSASDRLVRVARILAITRNASRHPEDLYVWFNARESRFYGKKGIELLGTDIGVHLIERYLLTELHDKYW
jgi:uncharacterized protein (DUF2384 family)